MRLLLGLAFVVVLAGCGAETGGPGAPGGQSAPAVPVAPAPPIVPLDEAPPAEVTRMLDEELAPLPVDFGNGGTVSGPSSVTTVLFTWGADTQVSGGTTSTTITPTSAQIAELRRQINVHREALEPASDSAPRAVARLPLADGGETLFVAWHNRHGLLCTYTNTTDAGGSGGGGAGGPCEGDEPARQCAAVCLASNGTGTASTERWVLTGTVAADADALDVTTADGATTEYPLTGPLLDGDRRVFLLELGVHDWRKLALVRGGRVVDETTMRAAAAAAEDCSGKIGPMPMPPTGSAMAGPVEQTSAMKAYNAAIQACLAASGAYPAMPAAPPLASTP